MESKDEGEIVTIDLLENGIKFFNSEYFIEKQTIFLEKNAYHFLILSECKSPDEEEQTLQMHLIFGEFQNMIDSLFAEFTSSNKSTIQSFFANCRDAMEGRFLPLFEEEHEHKWFVEDILRTYLDYNQFVTKMCKVARDLSSRKKEFHK